MNVKIKGGNECKDEMGRNEIIRLERIFKCDGGKNKDNG